MSQPQEQHHKPHCMWAKTQATHIGASSGDNVMPMQVSTGLSPTFLNDIQVAAASATAKVMEHRASSSSRPPPPSVAPKKAVSWTEKEHKLFLIGLEKYGKGDWKSISRFSVKSKTPCQVASHAQKYFLRQSVPAKKRKSIHDITLEETDHTLLSSSIDHHNSVPLPQNQCVDITLEESNHLYTDHQNCVATSQNQYHDISPPVSEHALVPYTDHQNWVAPSQNQCLRISSERSNYQHTDHQNWVAPSHNQCLISPELSNQVSLPRYIDHQNWIAPSQNQYLDIAAEVSSPALDPCYANHPNRLAPSQSLDTTTMRFAPIPHISNHQTSIISPQICDLPPQNGTYGMDFELLQLQAQQALSSLPPNNSTPQQMHDEYLYQCHLDMPNSLGQF